MYPICKTSRCSVVKYKEQVSFDLGISWKTFYYRERLQMTGEAIKCVIHQLASCSYEFYYMEVCERTDE